MSAKGANANATTEGSAGATCARCTITTVGFRLYDHIRADAPMRVTVNAGIRIATVVISAPMSTTVTASANATKTLDCIGMM
ncbi:MAG: hypothetical protein K6G31_14590 [Paludibacteraceae bacterium]|nr:hypothetical protein [Paludibacteraceae bacterium]